MVLEQRPERLPMTMACRILGLNRSSIYERRRGRISPDSADRSRKAARQPRALSPAERATVLAQLRSPRFSDQPPAEVYQRLLEVGQNPCSISTMHRLLREACENGERRPQRRAQHHAIPRLKAHAPNDVWTWDITKLPLVTRGVYLSLYVVLDLYSRFAVAWMVSRKENSALAKQLMNEAAARYAIAPGQLTLHQDRGSPMTAHGFLDDMNDLDITCSHSRPRVSNDNAFSESQFKTQKYQPDYPGRFDSVAHARRWCDQYFKWYNFEHHHSGLSGFTPVQVFTNTHTAVAEHKQRALDARYQSNPERFVKGPPVVKLPPASVSINPISTEDIEAGVADCVNFPTIAAAGYVRSQIDVNC